MDWNWKLPSWDLAEFEQEVGLNISPVSGSSSFGGHGSKGDFSVDLKLGHMVNLGNESAENSQVPSDPKMGLLPSGSSKRAWAVNNGIPAISCMVDGCDVDLISCKEYHRRIRNLMKAKEAVRNILMDTTVGEESLSQNAFRELFI